MDKIYLDLDFAIKSVFIDLEQMLAGNRHISVPYICGAPGGGKTSLIEEECKRRNWNLYTKNMAMILMETFTGIPDVKTNSKGEFYTIWSKPQIIEDLEQLASNGQPTVFFMDDWHHTAPSTQAIGFELFTHGKIQGYSLPPKTAICLAGNDNVMAGAREQLSAVMNRVSKKYVKTNYDSWKNSFAIGRINPIILGFLDVQENRRFFHMEESQFEPWASPRSWTYLSTKMNSIEASKLNYDNSQLIAEFASYVGNEVAANLIQHWIYYKTVNVDEIFRTGKFIIPSDIVQKFVFSHAVSYEFIRRCQNPKLKQNAMTIFGKILDSMYKASKESGAILVSNISIRHPEITTEMTKSGIISESMLRSLIKLTDAMGRLEC